MSVKELAFAIESDDVKKVATIPGIGRKQRVASCSN